MEPNGTQRDTVVTLLERYRQPGQKAALDSQPLAQNRPSILPALSSNDVSSGAPMDVVPSQANSNLSKNASPSPMPNNGLVSSDKREGDSISDESRPKKRARTDEHAFDEASSK